MEIRSICRLVYLNGLLLAIGFIATPCLAQIRFSAGAGLGTYDMADLKEINESFKLSVPALVTPQGISTFPPYATYEATLQYKIRRFQLGAYWSYNSTGSRLSYEDYSGSLWYDQKVSCNQYGITLGHLLTRNDGPWEVIPSLRLGVINTQYQVSDILQVTGNPAQSVVYKFTSNSYMISPGLSTNRVIKPWIALSFDFRYLLDLKQDLRSTAPPLTYIFGSNGSHMGANWSGIRLTLSVEVRFPGKKS